MSLDASACPDLAAAAAGPRMQARHLHRSTPPGRTGMTPSSPTFTSSVGATSLVSDPRSQTHARWRTTCYRSWQRPMVCHRRAPTFLQASCLPRLSFRWHLRLLQCRCHRALPRCSSDCLSIRSIKRGDGHLGALCAGQRVEGDWLGGFA